MTPNATRVVLRALYRMCLNRVPDEAGLAYFEQMVFGQGFSFEQVAAALMDSPEYRQLHAQQSEVRRDSLPRLAFVHVEKTAGTSFHDYLCEVYGPEHVFPERLWNLDPYTPAEFAAYRLYSGHFHYGECFRLPPDTRYVTFLRNPQERVLSMYYFWRSLKWDVARASGAHACIAKTHRLADFLRHPELTLQIDNAMIRRFLPQGAWSMERIGPTEAADALEALERFDFVGFKEAYSLSVVLVAQLFGWPLPSQLYERLSARELSSHPNHEPVEREPVTPEASRILADLTGYESELYNRALVGWHGRFEERFGVAATVLQPLPVPASV